MTWYLGTMNDGLFIIDTPPRPSTDEIWHERPNGPELVINVSALPVSIAEQIVQAHNAHPATDLAALKGELLVLREVLGPFKCSVCEPGECMDRKHGRGPGDHCEVHLALSSTAPRAALTAHRAGRGM